ncbi:hypothetical protein [Nitrospira sp. BLG_2]|uniref:hypothetical protein n=1 Tax=Nitrospira sp. BLG_2 TaxID=3397507 RepID=UPI003B9C9E10
MKGISNLSASFIFLQMPLYECVIWKPNKVFEIAATLYYPGTLDVHCVDSGKQSTFTCKNKALPEDLSLGSFQRKCNPAAAGGKQSTFRFFLMERLRSF